MKFLKNIFARAYLKSVSPEKDKRLFWEENYPHLLGEQIFAILRIIDKEVFKSYEFGLELSHEHLLKEKAAVFCILNKMGDLLSIPKKFEWEEAWKNFTELFLALLQEEIKFYFEKYKNTNKVKNMYNRHLETVAVAVLRAVYDRGLPYT